ncbi:MAG TPA: hypothetical protein VF941_24695 [Clostridia bacterium]
MSEYALFNLFGKKILGFFFSKAKDKIKNSYKGFKKRQYKHQFIQSIDDGLLISYGDKSFYNMLSKLIIRDDVLNKIYNRCYVSEINRYQTNEQFLKELTSSEEYQCFDGKRIEEILENIFNATFTILNMPEFDDTRKLMNVISEFRNVSLNNDNEIISSQNEMQKTLISIEKSLNRYMSLENYKLYPDNKDITTVKQEQKESTFYLNPILQFYNDNKDRCNIILNSSTDKPLFKISLTVKLVGDISNFLTFEQYLSYLMFTGEDQVFDVVEFKLQNAIDESVYTNIIQDYYGPIYKLPPLYAYSIESFPSTDEMKDMEMKIKLISPKDSMKISLQNEENDIIVDSKIYNINRKKLPNGDLEVIWNDASTNHDVVVTLTNIFRINKSIEDTKVISSNINISNINDKTALGRLKYHKILKRLISSKKIIYRNADSGSYIGECRGIKSEIDIDFIEKKIEIYNQLITIQDYFHIIFTMPDSFDFELVDGIRQVYEMILHGKTRISGYNFTFDKSKIGSQDEFKIGSAIMVTACFRTIELLDQELNFDNAIIIVPKAELSEITNESYKFKSVAPSYIVLKDKCKVLDEVEFAKNLLNEIDNEH